MYGFTDGSFCIAKNRRMKAVVQEVEDSIAYTSGPLSW